MVMAVVMNHVHIHVRLYTSSTEVCLPYFRVPLVLTTPFLELDRQPSCGDFLNLRCRHGCSDEPHAYPREAIHKQYTAVLTLLQGTTGYDHTPS